MDHSNVDVDIKQEETVNSSSDSAYITENGKQYRVPYRVIKQVIFTGLSKEELIDIPHAARLQYRLMLLDPVIKARVDFTKLKISVIYNPREADNLKEKISLEELTDFLSKQGVNVKSENTVLEDYDYYKDLYSYAYNPPSIRERAPYGYTKEEWQAMKPEYEKKLKESEAGKHEKFRKFQEGYVESLDPEIAAKVVEGYKPKPVHKLTLTEKIFGRKKEDKGKGFWFHGV
jgi:hypothetical protein